MASDRRDRDAAVSDRTSGTVGAVTDGGPPGASDAATSADAARPVTGRAAGAPGDVGSGDAPTNPYDATYAHYRSARAKFGARRFRPRTALYAWADVVRPLRARPGVTLLELGCQLGDLAHHVRGSGARVVGVDRNGVALRDGLGLWGRRGPWPVQGDLAAGPGRPVGLPFRSGVFHGAYSRDVLEHLPGTDVVDELFGELRRVLRPGAPMVHIVTVREDGPNLDADPTHHIKQDVAWWRDHFAGLGYRVGEQTTAITYGDNGQGFKRLVRHHGRFVLRPR